jgi:hypothetical protein
VPWATEAIAFAVVAAAVAGGLKRRRVLCSAMAALLLGLALEAAVHSVHHLGSDPRRAGCSVASVATNLSGMLEAPVHLERLALLQPAVPLPTSSLLPCQPVSLVQGRTPSLLP